MKAKPCPICKSKDVAISTEYTSGSIFARCPDCKQVDYLFKVKLPCPTDSIIREWNEYVKTVKSQEKTTKNKLTFKEE